MNEERIIEIQSKTFYRDSVSVKNALLQVWDECSKDCAHEIQDLRNKLDAWVAKRFEELERATKAEEHAKELEKDLLCARGKIDNLTNELDILRDELYVYRAEHRVIQDKLEAAEGSRAATSLECERLKKSLRIHTQFTHAVQASRRAFRARVAELETKLTNPYPAGHLGEHCLELRRERDTLKNNMLFVGSAAREFGWDGKSPIHHFIEGMGRSGMDAVEKFIAADKERDALKAETLRFYHADGTFETLASAEEVQRRRVECAKQIQDMTDRLAQIDAAREGEPENVRFPPEIGREDAPYHAEYIQALWHHVRQLSDARAAAEEECGRLRARVEELEAECRELEGCNRSLAQTNDAARSEGAAQERERIAELLASPELMEQLAAIEHDRWAGQAKTAIYDMTDERRERWFRLSGIPYAALDAHNQELDRMQVREYLPIIRAALAPQAQEGGE